MWTMSTIPDLRIPHSLFTLVNQPFFAVTQILKAVTATMSAANLEDHYVTPH